jgi:hypothetical protein
LRPIAVTTRPNTAFIRKRTSYLPLMIANRGFSSAVYILRFPSLS